MEPTADHRSLQADLHPEMAALAAMVASVTTEPPATRDVSDLRAEFEMLCSALGADAAEVDVEQIDLDGPAGRLPCRIYRPDAADRHAAALVWFHGGGWVIGSLDSHDGLCRDLATRSSTAVVAVDYRLAPEHPWPAAHDDAEAAFAQLWARSSDLGLDPARLMVGGDSAGGSLALAVSRRRHAHRQAPPAAQVLLYPVADLAEPDRYASRARNGEGLLLTDEMMRLFTDAYAPDPAVRGEPDLTPVDADLRGLPPTLLVLADFDPLVDEGRALAQRLAAADVDMTLEEVSGALHMVAQMRATELGTATLDLVADWLRSLRPAP